MARPRKENADYFPHDSNMRSSRKMIALRNKYWITWYAVYCMLIEHIASCDFFTSQWNEIEQEILSWDFWIDVTEIIDIVSFCHRLNMLQIDWQTLKCYQLEGRLSDMIDKRNRERNRVSVAETTQVVAESTQKKGKEIKGKEIKEKQTKINTTLSKDNTTDVVYGNDDINKLIELIKKTCKSNNLIYSWTGSIERKACKRILSKKFASEIESFGMDLETFIKNVIYVSTKLQYNTKVLTSATLIYYNRAEIVNKAKQQNDKHKAETVAPTKTFAKPF